MEAIEVGTVMAERAHLTWALLQYKKPSIEFDGCSCLLDFNLWFPDEELCAENETMNKQTQSKMLTLLLEVRNQMIALLLGNLRNKNQTT